MGAFGDGKERKKRTRTDKVGWGAAEFRGFVNIDLSEHDKAEFEVWWLTADIAAEFDVRCRQGIGLSLKYDAAGTCFQATGTQRDAGSANAGLAVSMRASDASKALARLLFVLSLLGAEDWTKRGQAPDNDRW